MRGRWRQGRARSWPVGLGGWRLARADRSLLAVLERDRSRAAARAGEHLRCAPGCSECCLGPFPITRLDVWRLRRGLAALEAADPARARDLRERARRAVLELSPTFPGEAGTGRLSESESAVEPFLERHRSMPCPALDPATGTCDLYDWRPVTCRTHGPPVRFGAESVPPCRLCFAGADPAEVERCRVEPDREGLEQEILERMGAAAGEDWETVVAFALDRR